MAGLKVFLSSTCVDMGPHRYQLRGLLDRMGYEPVMSEYSDVLYDHRVHTHTSCIREISNVDMVVLLIGPRFGGTAVPEAISDINLPSLSASSSKPLTASPDSKISITQLEILKAIELDIPVFAFVDSKVHADHHLYQKNKDQPFSDQIQFPSIEKPATARYIFEFINFISHRFSNNAIIPFSNFSDIEDHLTKQWSMIFQRLLREERDKSIEGRRADAMIEQIQDLKAVVLQSISIGSGRDIARSVLKYRRLAEFLIALRIFNPSFDICGFTGNFEDLLQKFGILGVAPNENTNLAIPRTNLIRDDNTHLRVRVPHRRFMQFSVDWGGFSQLEKDTKIAVLSGAEDTETLIPPILTQINTPYDSDENARITPDTTIYYNAPIHVSEPWTDERTELLKELWDKNHSASEIARILGNVTRNAVIGKAHRLGLPPTSPPDQEG